jgi:uncharacterized protein YjiS (DUF1127 family)
MTHRSPRATARPPYVRFLASRVALLRRLPDWIAQARRVAAERQTLGRMDDRMFADIGFDPATAKLEANRPFWDFDQAPAAKALRTESDENGPCLRQSVTP